MVGDYALYFPIRDKIKEEGVEEVPFLLRNDKALLRRLLIDNLLRAIYPILFCHSTREISSLSIDLAIGI
jgi:hypothetical protein